MKSLRLALLLLASTLACRSNDLVVKVMETEKQCGPSIQQQESSKDVLTPGSQDKPKNTLVREIEPAQEKAREQETAESQETKAPEAIYKLIEILERQKALNKNISSSEEELMRGITGLIIEETMTKIGYEFYEYFFLFWEPPEGIPVKDYNIVIHERASAMWGIWIWIDVNGTTIWNKMLRPRSAEVEEAAREAVEAAEKYLSNYEHYQFKTHDMMGTGVW